MCWNAYKRIIDEMIDEEESLACSPIPVRENVREWVRLSYQLAQRERFGQSRLSWHLATFPA